MAVQQSSNFMDIQSALESLLSYISELFTDEGNCQRLQLLIVVLPEEKGHYGMYITIGKKLRDLIVFLVMYAAYFCRYYQAHLRDTTWNSISMLLTKVCESKSKCGIP